MGMSENNPDTGEKTEKDFKADKKSAIKKIEKKLVTREGLPDPHKR
jgi:hypothetical protein